MIEDYLTQTIQILRRTGHDTTGTATYAAPVSRLARVQHRRRMIRNPQGEQLISDMQIWLKPGTPVGEGDRIAYGGVTYHVMSVNAEYALDELSHLVVWTGRTGD